MINNKKIIEKYNKKMETINKIEKNNKECKKEA